MTLSDSKNKLPYFPGFPGVHVCLCISAQTWVCGMSPATGKVRFCRRQLGVRSHFRETAIPEMSCDRTQTKQLRKRSGWIDSLRFREGGEAHAHAHIYAYCRVISSVSFSENEQMNTQACRRRATDSMKVCRFHDMHGRTLTCTKTPIGPDSEISGPRQRVVEMVTFHQRAF